MRHPSIRKSGHYSSPTIGGSSVGIVHLRTKGHGVDFSPVGDQERQLLSLLRCQYYQLKIQLLVLEETAVMLREEGNLATTKIINYHFLYFSPSNFLSEHVNNRPKSWLENISGNGCGYESK
jgi:hypothetical protein